MTGKRPDVYVMCIENVYTSGRFGGSTTTGGVICLLQGMLNVCVEAHHQGSRTCRVCPAPGPTSSVHHGTIEQAHNQCWCVCTRERATHPNARRTSFSQTCVQIQRGAERSSLMGVHVKRETSEESVRQCQSTTVIIGTSCTQTHAHAHTDPHTYTHTRTHAHHAPTTRRTTTPRHSGHDTMPGREPTYTHALFTFIMM
jgi:hypothetical protein